MNTIQRWRHALSLSVLICAFVCLRAMPAGAAALPVTVSYDPLEADYCGVTTNIGSLTATLSTGANRRPNDNQITATAVVNAPYQNCATFHWVQVITSANPGTFAPLEYGGKPLDNANDGNPIPIIDPPNPNYDGNPPEDGTPWYLTAAEEGGSNPNIGGNVTTPAGTTYTMIDQPNYGGFIFDTFFVGVTGAQSMGVIAAFTWGYGTTGGSASLALLGNDPGVGAGLLATLNQALDNGGFTGWTATDGFDIPCCMPLPASASMGAVLMLVMAGYSLRRRLAA
jgi:hypothetical protein